MAYHQLAGSSRLFSLMRPGLLASSLKHGHARVWFYRVFAPPRERKDDPHTHTHSMFLPITNCRLDFVFDHLGGGGFGCRSYVKVTGAVQSVSVPMLAHVGAWSKLIFPFLVWRLGVFPCFEVVGTLSELPLARASLAPYSMCVCVLQF